MARDRSNLVWIDLETTGLNVGRRAILEIASIVTDKDLGIVDEGPALVIHQSDDVLARLDPWCERRHGPSGLLEASRSSDISLREAEQETLRFVRKHTQRRTAPLCGNGICFDRRFLVRHMPELNDHMSFRNVDVSSIKELAHRWYPGVVEEMQKALRHRASDDIRESIEELRLYRRLIFKD